VNLGISSGCENLLVNFVLRPNSRYTKGDAGGFEELCGRIHDRTREVGAAIEPEEFEYISITQDPIHWYVKALLRVAPVTGWVSMGD